MIGWHRLFGLTLTDFFAGSPFEVELEKDLSVRQQLLDTVILRKQPGEFPGRLPDGLDNLADHNLLTYKSLWEPLDDWAIDELVGHYVNYRKQVSPSHAQLLPARQIELYAVSTRFPQKLGELVELRAKQSGVYELAWGTHRIRVLVLSQMPDSEQNAIWELFSGVPEKVASGRARYHGGSGQTSTIINELLQQYGLEGIAVPYTMDDFVRDYTREHLDVLPPEERLRGLPPEERLRGLSAEDILRSIPSEEELGDLSAGILERLPTEKIEALLAKRRRKGN